MNWARTWFDASRPFSFTASVIPVLIGTIYAADDSFRLWAAVLAVAGSVAIHAGTNLVNDYYDFKKGADPPGVPGAGRLMHAGTVRPRSVLLAGAACFAAGSAIGLGLCAATDWTLLYLGLASVIAGFLYTGWPIHLAYIALGELTVFVFMGPVMVVGAYFVQVERWSWDPVLVSLPIAFLVTAILQANNIRDIEHDREVGKRTIATLVGRKWANREMYFLLAAAFASTVAIAAAGVLPWPALVSLAALPLVRPVVTVIRTETSPRRLTMALLGCVRLHMRFGLLMCAGLVAWVVLERA